MFNTRAPGATIIMIGRHPHGRNLKTSVENGDSVTLRAGEQHVLIQNVASLGDGQYCGVISGFEPSFKLEHEGLKMEQKVEFKAENIFSCTSA